ncbi:nuclear transport factor 2 family protein [Pseudonocardia pini]|uniref:nuclear transport factor 2 family protein n=1 Tax=Pseudonocardia pini TaxID=2758030 RepID=UPI0015F0CDD5|nr:nuclear transport factor 2 family protein [Pseudonocardia pini]
MTPDQLLATEAIRYTQSVYNTEGDRGRVDALLEAFLPEGVLEFHGTAHEGREAIRAALSPKAAAVRSTAADTPRRVFLRHNLTTSRIEFDGADAADAWTYFMVVSPIGLDHTGVYVDRFVRRGDRWLLARRRVKIDWAAPDSPQAAHVPE